MDHTPLDQGMFWVGAMMVFTPMICAGIVLAVWWRGKQRQDRERQEAGASSTPPVT